MESFFHEPPPSLPRQTGRIRSAPGLSARYVDFLVSRISGPFPDRLTLVLDCGNGATCRVAPKAFARLGIPVRAIHIRPDGMNINWKCGSQDTGDLQKEVLRNGASLGLAFDGDGDRCIAVDEAGRPVSGDRILLACARAMDASGRLANRTVVSTVMSNLGLKKALDEAGIRHVETDVGDRQVLSAMRKHGAVLGGEDSGHMIFADRHATGDGILTGLELFTALAADGRPLSALTQMEVFPQVLVNVPVRERKDLDSLAGVRDAEERARKTLGADGRVLVRYSGTRLVCRVMVESRDEETTRSLAEDIADAVKRELGAS
ncbi:MAG: phosphoglucosamine mutase [Pseudomonadota bacterium]